MLSAESGVPQKIHGSIIDASHVTPGDFVASLGGREETYSDGVSEFSLEGQQGIGAMFNVSPDGSALGLKSLVVCGYDYCIPVEGVDRATLVFQEDSVGFLLPDSPRHPKKVVWAQANREVSRRFIGERFSPMNSPEIPVEINLAYKQKKSKRETR